MNWLRRNWVKIGLIAAIILSITLLIFHNSIDSFRTLMTVNLITLFLHQTEEYFFPGRFPLMMNKVMFKSKDIDRYPLNANTSFLINACFGWSVYILAIIFGTSAVWLATGAVLISVGNIVAHVFIFNIKGKTFYNPGMATSIVLFLPFTIYFFTYCFQHSFFTAFNLIVGVIVGFILNYFGVLKPITMLADKNTHYHF